MGTVRGQVESVLVRVSVKCEGCGHLTRRLGTAQVTPYVPPSSGDSHDSMAGMYEPFLVCREGEVAGAGDEPILCNECTRVRREKAEQMQRGKAKARTVRNAFASKNPMRVREVEDDGTHSGR